MKTVYLLLYSFFIFSLLTFGCSSETATTDSVQITEEGFGQLDDGRDVHLYTLTNSNAIEVKITNYGGIITSLRTPDSNGTFDNIVLGFDNIEDYLADHPYFGALIGRFGNRIENGTFELDGTEYQLSINDGENHLHGGERGFDRVLWDAEVINDSILRLSYLSPDGEEGYPGNLQVYVDYKLTNDNELRIDFEATTDQATPVNLTAHSYFNLTGNPANSVLDHQLKLYSDSYTPVNEQLIPTGEIQSVESTPFDFSDFQTIGSRIDRVDGGYDHNYVLNEADTNERIAAELIDPVSGRKLTVLTTEPGIQFYSGNFLDGTLESADGTPFEQYAGLCLEPQHFPNSPNEPDFPSVILRPDDMYRSSIVYRFEVE